MAEDNADQGKNLLADMADKAESTKDKLHNAYWSARTKMMYAKEGEMNIADVKSLFETGTAYRREYVEGYLTEEKRKKFTGEGTTLDQEWYWQTAEYFFDDWQKWDNARLALEGKAPIIKAVDLLIELEQEETGALDKMKEARPATELGIGRETPEDLRAKIVMEDMMISSFRRARTLVERDWQLRKQTAVQEK